MAQKSDVSRIGIHE